MTKITVLMISRRIRALCYGFTNIIYERHTGLLNTEGNGTHRYHRIVYD
jgi:hypothetical protein